MPHRYIALTALAILLAATSESLCSAESPSKSVVKDWMDFYLQRAKGYEIIVNDEAGESLQLHPSSLLQYTNPVRQREQHGAVFVWTADGRPQAIGTIWSILDLKNNEIRRTAHELHSLSEKPFSAKRPPAIEGRLNPLKFVPDWKPNAGVRFSPLPSDQPVAETAAGRLIQMRRLFSTFDAILIDRNDGSQSPLRRLPSPLMRYQSKKQGVIDGCLFTFVMGTDPELFLLIECREDADGVKSWHYTAARFTGMALRLNRGGEEVWQVEKIMRGQADQVYDLVIGFSILPHDHPSRDEPTSDAGASPQPPQP